MRFVAKAEKGKGWRIWNRKMKRWWGNYFQHYPEELLDELNGPRRPVVIQRLNDKNQTKKKRI